MNAAIGWGLAALAVVLGYHFYGWPGVALALSVIVFWLLLQVSRALRAMRAAAEAPKGHVASAVMLQAKLRPGLRLMEVIQRTRSLGEPVAQSPESYRWTDAGGVSVTVEFENGRCTRWRLQRPDA
ncbi:MAG: hypothetical protein HY021_02210 [Burkholderiales bacterium]|nr:hypothetical protein [Burkholderiales bacterium]